MDQQKTKGRPSKYPVQVKPHLDKIRHWAAQGACRSEIAQKLKVSLTSLKNYQTQYSELAEALDEGFQIADEQVEAALFKRALGFEYETFEQIQEELSHQGKPTGETKTKEVKKKVKVLGEISAQVFWLKNRCPGRWRDKQEMKHQVKGGIVFLPQVANNQKDWASLVIEHEQQQDEDNEPKDQP